MREDRAAYRLVAHAMEAELRETWQCLGLLGRDLRLPHPWNREPQLRRAGPFIPDLWDGEGE